MSLSIISRYNNIFDKKEKKELFFFSLIIITMVLEVFSIGLIIPVIMSIMNQDVSSAVPFLEPFFIFLDGYSSQEVIIFTSLILVLAYMLKIFTLFF